MGEGYGANFVITVEEEKLDALNLSTLHAFKSCLLEHNVGLLEFARSIQAKDRIYDKTNEQVEEFVEERLDQLYQEFQAEFLAKHGVPICIGKHNKEEEGDRYDDVNGYYFALDFSGVYQLTEAAQALKEKTDFEMKFFVTYG